MEEQTLKRIEKKLDLLLNSRKHRINEKKYITAREVEDLTGLNYRTILNRSNLDEDHPRFIPSIQFGGSRRKYFERKVIERIFHLS
ncbi:hypothetical protein [Halalkalibaculum sp. DA384]|uniref:hypothetical protein n=1 Tax=Halalkalibaculum sp. DA384 TaxID=3373606 RepID=UPI003754A824